MITISMKQFYVLGVKLKGDTRIYVVCSIKMAYSAKYQSTNRFAAFGEEEQPRTARATTTSSGYRTWKRNEDNRPETKTKKLDFNERNFPTLVAQAGSPSPSQPVVKSLAERLKDSMMKEQETVIHRHTEIWSKSELESIVQKSPTKKGRYTLISCDYPDLRITVTDSNHRMDRKTSSSLKDVSYHGGIRSSDVMDEERNEEIRRSYQESSQMDGATFQEDSSDTDLEDDGEDDLDDGVDNEN
jgi:hypothetical protein